MQYAVRYYASLGIVEVAYSGLITAPVLRDATTEAVGLQRQHGVTRFLVNLGDGDVRVAPEQLEDLLDQQYRQEEVNRRTRVAIVQPSAATAKQAAAYYVDASRRRGWVAEILADRNAAMDWLGT